MSELCKICGKQLEKVTECAWTSCPKWIDETDEKAFDSAVNGGEEV